MSVYYKFVLDSLETFPDPLVGLDLLSDTLASTTFSGLDDSILYYWRVMAMASDNSDSSDWSIVTQFDLVTGVNAILAVEDCVYPLNGDVVHAEYPALIVNNLTGIDNYYFQLDDNSQFSYPQESGPVMSSGGSTTSWQATDPLENGRDYFWRVSSDGAVWTEAIQFATMFDIHAYPNPFRPANGHTYVTFTNLLEESDIVISTISGSKVLEQADIGPEDWVWDGRNDNGEDLSPGVYLYNIDFPSGSTSGKLLVIK
jgi:hypothetical protein